MVTVIFAFWHVSSFWWPVFMCLLAAQPVSKFEEAVICLQWMNRVFLEHSSAILLIEKVRIMKYYSQCWINEFIAFMLCKTMSVDPLPFLLHLNLSLGPILLCFWYKTTHNSKRTAKSISDRFYTILQHESEIITQWRNKFCMICTCPRSRTLTQHTY
jgi:hypothetical protein